MSEPIRIGTRGSRLALWQAHRVRDLLTSVHPGLEVEIVIIKTRGDRDQKAPLGTAGGIGFFTKEIEEALRERRVDLAVHSLKDLPTEIVPGLVLAAVPEREDPRDVLVGRPGRVASLDDLDRGFTVATSSPRRRGQILVARPGIDVVPLRGNVPTRIGKVTEEGGPDAVLLALAGLKRLGLTEHVTEKLSLGMMLPAAGQGALGLETREDDDRVLDLLAPLDDPGCRAAVTAERAFLHRLEGGCTVPAGVHASPTAGGMLRIEGVVADPDGRALVRCDAEGEPGDPEGLGVGLAEDLLEEGAGEILANLGRDVS